jgi:putative transposase
MLEAAPEVQERRNQLRHPSDTTPERRATGPHQGWSWDMTQRKGPATWTDDDRSVMLDIFRRDGVGGRVAHRERATVAARVIAQTCAKQRMQPGELPLPADRGSAMRSQPVAWLLADLGVTKTQSRPYGSEDNPYSESPCKTLTYRPECPERFGARADARHVCQVCFPWYNTEPHHGGIGLVPPHVVHDGREAQMLQIRHQTLAEAYAKHPARFVRTPPRPTPLPEAVWSNNPKEAAQRSTAEQDADAIQEGQQERGRDTPPLCLTFTRTILFW